MNAIIFTVASLQQLDVDSLKAVLDAGLSLGWYDLDDAGTYAALCEADELSKEYMNRWQAFQARVADGVLC
jgi:hypothetical protein